MQPKLTAEVCGQFQELVQVETADGGLKRLVRAGQLLNGASREKYNTAESETDIDSHLRESITFKLHNRLLYVIDYDNLTLKTVSDVTTYHETP